MKSVTRLLLLVTVVLFTLNRDGKTKNVIPDLPFHNTVREIPAPLQQNIAGRYSLPQRSEELLIQRNSERRANTDWVKEATMKYSPYSWYLLMSYDSLPAESSVMMSGGGTVSSEKTAGTFEYLRGRTRIDMLVSMETNVHEIAHAYFDKNVFRYLNENKAGFNPNNANGFIYISPGYGWFISFPLRSIFPSAELASVIPARLRTYRYDTYIAGTTSTQSEGIIGLLNELQAYYIGSRFCYDMLKPYQEAAGSDVSGLFEWVTHTQSSMSAFYEFDFFISEYLLHMKQRYPDSYRLLKSYQAFTTSYKAVRDLYIGLIGSYTDMISSEAARLNGTGESVARLEDGWLWIRSGGSHISSGTPVFSEERKILLPVLESRRYREIWEDF